MRHAVAVPVPWETTAGRDDRTAPVVNVMLMDDGADGVAVPWVYGYPLYAEGDAEQSIAKLRHDNWTGATQEQTQDDAGVVHVAEHLPALGCRFDGIQETPSKFVPLSFTCELPPPKALGGNKRPVLGELTTGAKAASLLKEKSIEQAFLGEFHLKSDGFDAGNGIGYFNTTHGQLAFGFERGKLARVIYYFDPSVKAWQTPTLWVNP